MFISNRKICKHCRCGPEDHDLTDEDDREKQPMKLLLDDRHGNALSSRLHKLNIEDPAIQSEIVTPENDLVIHRIIAENLVSFVYFSYLHVMVWPVSFLPSFFLLHPPIHPSICHMPSSIDMYSCYSNTMFLLTH